MGVVCRLCPSASGSAICPHRKSFLLVRLCLSESSRDSQPLRPSGDSAALDLNHEVLEDPGRGSSCQERSPLGNSARAWGLAPARAARSLQRPNAFHVGRSWRKAPLASFPKRKPAEASGGDFHWNRGNGTYQAWATCAFVEPGCAKASARPCVSLITASSTLSSPLIKDSCLVSLSGHVRCSK